MSRQGLFLAVEDFRRARRQAALQHIMSRLTGRPDELLSYVDVRAKLRAVETATQQLKAIPMDSIVGSVGRYADFTRTFLPRRNSDAQRWARVQMKVTGLEGLPPIEVYQIGDVYFVRDGHHRVSVARQLGATDMEAYVTEVRSKVPISPDVRPDDLILKAEYTTFLQETKLDDLLPEADLSVTVPGQYLVLKEHIDVHCYFMGLDQQRDISYDEAVTHWYNEVYLPVVQAIRERGILRDFPGRTEADLYIWLAEHRAALGRELGWDVEPGTAAADLAARSSRRPQRVVARVTGKLVDAAIPDALEDGPSPGQWRREHQTARRAERLFLDILVPVSGEPVGWRALGQAMVVARREGARLHGIYAVSSPSRKEGRDAQALKAEFDRRCKAAGVVGQLAVEVGPVSRTVCEQARWADLVVVNVSHIPPPEPVGRLSSGFRTMIRRCPGPVLAVRGVSSAMNRALLAYDGSPKAEEALFLATYLSARWNIPLVVVTVKERGRTTADTLDRARSYLETHDIRTTFVEETGPVASVVMQTAEAHGSDFIILGGYGFNPVLEVMLGSSVDRVLRESGRPVLICR